MLPATLFPLLVSIQIHARQLEERTSQLSTESERLNTLIETLPDAVFFRDGNDRLVTVNMPGIRLFQLENVDWKGKTDEELMAEYPHLQDNRVCNYASNDTVWETGQRLDITETINGPFGVKRYFDVTKVPLFNPDGSRKGLVIIGRDVSDRTWAQESLRKSEERWQFALESNGDGVWDRDLINNTSYFSKRYQEMLGYEENELPAKYKTWEERLHPDDRERVLATIQRHLDNKIPHYTEEYRLQHKNGSWVWVLARGKVVSRDNTGKPLRIIGTHTDISERKKIETELALAASVFESNTESIIICSAPDNRIVRVNRTFTEMTGYSAEDAIGKNPRFLSAMDQSLDYYQSLWDTVLESGEWQGELLSRRKNGEIYPGWLVVSTIRNEHGEITHFMSMLADISERKKAESRIHNLAYFDTLTGLPNRPMLDEHLKLALANAHRYGSRVALMFLDLDHFKTINDSLGHIAGDKLLKSTGMRIASCLREGDTLARLGGDEFVILLPSLPDNDTEAMGAVTKVIEKISKAMAVPFNLEKYEAVVTPSIGVAIYPQDAQNPVDLIRNADAAMYHAKNSGRNNHQFYAVEMNLAAVRRLKMDTELRRALNKQEFVLHYQPQVNRQGKMVAVEALLRWHNSELDTLSPSQFIPLAEETGLIVPIGEWILNKACAQMKAWQTSGLYPDLKHICINISPRQFAQADFVSTLTNIIKRYELASNCVELELTEGILMHDTKDTMQKLETLKSLGFNISIDDFGTGYSSLAYLKNFPIDVLKIDQSFIRDITEQQHDSAISRAIIVMAKSLNLGVVAEGVETAQQLNFLKESGCEVYQGFYFGKPMTAEALTPTLH